MPAYEIRKQTSRYGKEISDEHPFSNANVCFYSGTNSANRLGFEAAALCLVHGACGSCSRPSNRQRQRLREGSQRCRRSWRKPYRQVGSTATDAVYAVEC